MELKRIHVVSVGPINAATDDMKNNKYVMVSTAAVTRAVQIVDGQVTTRPRDTTPPPNTAAAAAQPVAHVIDITKLWFNPGSFFFRILKSKVMFKPADYFGLSSQ